MKKYIIIIYISIFAPILFLIFKIIGLIISTARIHIIYTRIMIDENNIPHSLPIKDITAWEQAVNTLFFLRTKEGCAWDKAQTMESIIVNLIEEVSELIDAIHTYVRENQNNDEHEQHKRHLIEEFGDVHLVLTMMIIIFNEKSQQTTFSDIFTQLKDKLIRRHPHVFTHKDMDMKKDALHTQWQDIKYHVEGKREPKNLDEYKPYLHILERVKEIQKKIEKLGLQEKSSFNIKILALEKNIKSLYDADTKIPDKESFLPSSEDMHLHVGRCFYELIDIARTLHISPTTCLSKYMNTVLAYFDNNDNTQ